MRTVNRRLSRSWISFNLSMRLNFKKFKIIEKKLDKIIGGFTLAEFLIGLGIFSILGLGFYQVFGIFSDFSYNFRLNAMKINIANEWLEIVRNMPYDSIGTIYGSPQGVLPDATTTSRGDFVFNVEIIPRWIDDPFDGLAPEDAIPTDYKKIEIKVGCVSCFSSSFASLVTIVSPPYLETAGDYGFLFINVFDASGQAVAQANVNVQSIDLEPQRIINTVSDNSGKVQLFDLTPATYRIYVSKEGYSYDGTLPLTPENPNPVKPDILIFQGQVSQSNFQIDKLASIQLETKSVNCAPIGSIDFVLSGSKLIGREPDVLKYSPRDIVTNGSGEVLISNLEWDVYNLILKTGQDYDLAGSLPLIPVNLNPGQNLVVKAILAPHTTNTLLVTVKDAASGLPLSNAQIRLFKEGYDKTLISGIGFLKQTDWFEGPGQEDFEDPAKYFSDDGFIDATSEFGSLKLKTDEGGNYYPSASLISSTFDTGSASSSYTNILWLPLSQPPETGTSSVKFQFAASSDKATWEFSGPDGTSGTYYDAVNNNLNNQIYGDKRYFRYKIFLSTETATSSPLVSDISVTFSAACVPSGQVLFQNLEEGTYNLTVNREGYQDFSDSIPLSGQVAKEINLFPL